MCKIDLERKSFELARSGAVKKLKSRAQVGTVPQAGLQKASFWPRLAFGFLAFWAFWAFSWLFAFYM